MLAYKADSPPSGALWLREIKHRHQLNVLQRKCPKRVPLSIIDKLLLVGFYRGLPKRWMRLGS